MKRWDGPDMHSDCPYCRDGIPRTEYGVHFVNEIEVEICISVVEVIDDEDFGGTRHG